MNTQHPDSESTRRARVRVRNSRAPRVLVRAVTASALVIAGAAAVAPAASAATPPPGLSPVAQRAANGVTADALPTVQIDGVVWSQAVVGNTVYAGGSFANARPAGAAPGTNLTPRANLLSYNITTGALNTSFAPSLNGEVKTVTASPDGSRIYVGGAFTTANGQPRYRIAAYSTSTGQLISNFAPTLDAEVNAIVATNTTVYVGGGFSMANNVPRAHLAAFSASDGSLLGWAPSADNNQVEAMVMAPGGAKLVVGGSFTSLNGSSSAYGLGAVDPNTGALVPWATSSVVRDAGTGSAILSLSTDGTNVYGTGYDFNGGGNLEGTFASDPTGNLNWIEDCHGDTYSVFGVNNAVYTVSHAHMCGNIGGYPENVSGRTWQHALAFTANATGTVFKDTTGYPNFSGNPSPSLIDWMPDLTEGTYTGQNQAAWNVSGNSQYVVLGGEFPTVNGTAQQGLVRFGVPSVTTPKQGPRLSGADFTPTLRPVSSSSVRVSWPANWDRDDMNLTYTVVRDGDVNHPIYTTTGPSEWWSRPIMGTVDTGLTPGSTHNYFITATDPNGNAVRGDYLTITVPTTSPSKYAQQIPTDNASAYYRFDEQPGSTLARDASGGVDLTEGSGVTEGASGAIIGDPDTAANFSGSSSGTAWTPSQITAPNNYSLEAWFKTTSAGGKIIGFGNTQSGTSSQSDRQVYLDNSGHLLYGVFTGANTVVSTPGTYNDGAWHQVVATLSSAGMVLYVDGAKVASNASVTNGRPASGFWRVGGDSLSGWPSAPSNSYFRGALDDVAIYPSALTLATVQNHYVLSGRTPAGGVNTPPTASFTSSCTNLACTFDGSASSDPGGTVASYAWSFGDGTSGTGAKPSHTYASGGTYTVTLTVTDNNGGTGAISHPVTVTAPDIAPTAAFTSSCTNLACGFDGSGSNDPDGSIASYAWNFGDGTSGTGAKPSHTYTAAATYTVTLKVTDNSGSTNSVSRSVTVTAPTAPTASFTPSCTNLACTFDGSASSPSSGATISSYAWTFGDNSTGTGVKPSHTYVAGGTYNVTLTVTDSAGRTASVTKTVSVAAAPSTLISDDFTRTVSGGWGTAPTGGAWATDPAASFAVANGQGTATMSAAGTGTDAELNSVSQTNLNVLTDTSVNKVTTGNGVFFTELARENGAGTNAYRFQIRYLSDGTVHLVLSKLIGGVDTTFQEVAVPGLTYTPGTMLRSRFTVSGSGTTTLTGKIWVAGSAEPTAAQIAVTDNDANLQGAGSFGIQTYLAGSATNAPITLAVDNLSATAN